MPVGPRYQPEPRFPDLGEAFSDPVTPARFPEHRLRFRNDPWAGRVGLELLDDAEWIDHFGRFAPLPDNIDPPRAMRYHGHQFGAYNPELGDGRGFLFAQLREADGGRLLDLGTKGSGRTPYSRSGDGRLTLKGGVREILAAEMLEALGVYTSKAFSLIETGEQLVRGDEPSPTRSCVLVRLSHSHVRFGTFQRHAAENAPDRLQALVDHAVELYFPELVDAPDRPSAFLQEVVRRSGCLVASWMVAGFVHGVLNTDNMNVTGESFDYGPWRFLPTYDPGFVAAYFDHGGFYAYGRQPRAVAWNVSRLAETLLPIAREADLEAALEGFVPAVQNAYRRKALRRLGLGSAGDSAEDDATVEALLAFLRDSEVDYAQVFHDWWGGAASEARARESPASSHYRGPAFEAFRRRLDRHVASDPERLTDPHFQRDHPPLLLLPQVEEVWEAIARRDDWSLLNEKVAEIRAAGRVLGPGDPGDDGP